MSISVRRPSHLVAVTAVVGSGGGCLEQRRCVASELELQRWKGDRFEHQPVDPCPTATVSSLINRQRCDRNDRDVSEKGAQLPQSASGDVTVETAHLDIHQECPPPSHPCQGDRLGAIAGKPALDPELVQQPSQHPTVRRLIVHDENRWSGGTPRLEQADNHDSNCLKK